MVNFSSLATFVLLLVLLLLPESPADNDAANPIEGTGECRAGDASAACSADATSAPPKPKTISVVLPCANEGQFALNTVKAVHASTPAGVLQEIVVVDDGSKPKLTKKVLTKKVRAEYGVRLIRHSETEGLIRAKQTGGDAALGDIVVFFDCHVAPQEGWYKPFLELIAVNYRRIVVPVITDLDIDTWTQTKSSHSNDKCYLSFDADFKWFESRDHFVPVLSGGLLGMSKRWWNETGGYDEEMQGWGGENIDQSLRTWLCGGEIVSAQSSAVAHMWRKPEDPRTESKYDVHPMNPMRNRLRAAMAWYGAFEEKMSHFPQFRSDMKGRDGGPWYGSLDNIKAISRRLKCKPFVWYLHRFKSIYKDSGLIPKKTFALRHGHDGHCLTFEGPAGTNPHGHAEAVLMPCSQKDHRQQWHGANRNLRKKAMPCCSGLRAWNTDQCIESANEGSVQLYTCAIAGHHHKQQWKFQKGRLRGGMHGDECIEVNGAGELEVEPCDARGDKAATSWTKYGSSEPLEAKLYREQLSLLESVAGHVAA